MALPNEVFLSHSPANIQFVRELASVLNRHGVPTWLSDRDILGAKQWHDEIGAALARCDWFVAIISTAALDSMWMKREVLFALNENRFNNRIVPVQLDSADATKLSWALPSIEKVSFVSDFDQGCKDLLRIWGIGYKGASQ